jgi:hypothetical protein
METSLIDTVLTSISAHTVLKPTSTTSELPYKYNDFAHAAHMRNAAARARWAMACPPRGRKGRTRLRRVTTVSSTDIFLAPRSARRSDASNAARRSGWHRRLAGSGARAAGLASAPRCALRAARVARTPQTQPGGRRAEACCATGRLPGCGARAFKRSLAEVVRNGAFGGRTLARALPRSYDRAWARRAGAPAPYRLRRPPWAAAAQTARLAFAHAAEDGRARSEPESA